MSASETKTLMVDSCYRDLTTNEKNAREVGGDGSGGGKLSRVSVRSGNGSGGSKLPSYFTRGGDNSGGGKLPNGAPLGGDMGGGGLIAGSPFGGDCGGDCGGGKTGEGSGGKFPPKEHGSGNDPTARIYHKFLTNFLVINN